MSGQARKRKNDDGSYKYYKGSNFKFNQFETKVRGNGSKLMQYDLLKNKKVNAIG